MLLKRLTPKSASKFAFAAAAALPLPPSSFACEPIVPFVKVVAGPAFLTGSFLALGLVVLAKSAAFAYFQSSLTYSKAFLLMVAGNILTSIIGVLAAVMIGSGEIMLIGIPIVWALCLMPAKRLVAASPYPFLARSAPGAVAFGMTACLVLSCILFVVAQEVMSPGSMVLYWIFKLLAIYAALIVSIALTAFWEEWVVWRLSRLQPCDTAFVQPVIRANLLVLLAVMVISAGIMIPQRLKSPGFIVPEKSKAELRQTQSNPPLLPTVHGG